MEDTTPKIDLERFRRSLAAVSFSGFVRYTFPGYSMGTCHESICLHLDRFLEDVRNKRSPRLMICMPPRHGKSELASRRFPAYVFGRHNDMSIIAASYSADLASRMSRDVQRIMSEPNYAAVFPKARLPSLKDRGYVRTTNIFEIAGHRGSYRAAGVGGGITGMGGDILIIDDPIKDRMEADSPTVRNSVWDWYTSTLYTRLSPGGGIIVMLTRWHMDDLAGRLLEAERMGEGDHWQVINYPAIAEADEYIGERKVRSVGEALHPERYPLEQLDAIRAAIGSRDWAAMYQQKPTPDGGAIFRAEWLQFYGTADLPKRWDQQLISWDMTFKDNDDNDFCVGQVWGKSGGSFYLLDQIRARMGFTATVEAFKSLAERWPHAHRILVEDTANGPAIIDSLKSSIPGIIPVKVGGSKTARAHAVTTFFEAGNVRIPHPSVAPWVSDYVAELTQFPAGAHDDQVDATTQALSDLKSHGVVKFDPVVNRRPSFYGPARRFF